MKSVYPYDASVAHKSIAAAIISVQYRVIIMTTTVLL